MLTKLKMIDMLKLHIDNLNKELEKTSEIEHRVALMKEKGETIRALKDLID